jgi:hypothetical protein
MYCLVSSMIYNRESLKIATDRLHYHSPSINLELRSALPFLSPDLLNELVDVLPQDLRLLESGKVAAGFVLTVVNEVARLGRPSLSKRKGEYRISQTLLWSLHHLLPPPERRTLGIGASSYRNHEYPIGFEI